MKVKEYLKSHRNAYLKYRKYRYDLILRMNVFKKQFLNVIDFRYNKLMINLGGGNYFRRHWKVMDYPSPHYSLKNWVLDYEYDLTSRKPFPLSDNSVYAFFCSHTMEHIPQEYCSFILKEIYRTLMPNGTIRFTNDDFEKAYRAYSENNIKFFEKYEGNNIDEKFLCLFATWYMHELSPQKLEENVNELRRLHKVLSMEELADYFTLKIPKESQKKRSGNHINWWTCDKYIRMLKECGFSQVYKSQPQQSKCLEMRGFGRNSGFDSTHPEISLFVEAIK